MRTPQVVKDEAKSFLEEGAKLYHIGEYNGYEVYQVGFPPDECTGILQGVSWVIEHIRII